MATVTSGRNIVPQVTGQNIAPVGVRAVSPTTNIKKPATTLPSAQKAPSSLGSYKGVAINPGDQASIQAQMARIDSTPVQQASTAYNAPASAPAQAPQAPQAPVAPAPTYPGLMGQLIQNAQNTAKQGQVTPEESAARASLASIPGVAGGINQAFAEWSANNSNQAIPVAFQQGRQQVESNLQANRLAALGQKEQALGNAVNAFATERTANVGANTAAGSQFGTALGYAQPQVVGQGQAVFDPLTAQIGGGNFDVQTNASNFAKNVLNGSMTYDQAVSALGYSNVGKAALDQALTQAGGNPLQLQASGSANQSIIGGQTQTVAGYTSALQQGQNLQSQLTDLISTFGLNPGDVNAVNVGLQKIAANVSDPRYKILQNYVNDIANTYAQILTPPGGSATDTTRGIAASMLDATAKGTSIVAVMHSLDEAAKAKIAGVPTTQSSTQQSSNSGGSVGWY